ncbi:hypothetical protein Pla175_06290 [Pirellulimonas nuda]|uniref:Uncharacterized protein n=1 Tax=Pirellulimonas nuda TaxID=2528009 RepID=A0A518D739_9BACT|nr:hypothetical protein Pla175_06290 [Pirellulimonas nuda]
MLEDLFGGGVGESASPFGGHGGGGEADPFGGGGMERDDTFGGGGEFGRRGGAFGGEYGGAFGNEFAAEQPAEGPNNQGFQFPTAEEQRYADRAFHLLGLEVEKLSAEESERVKKLGLKGGVRIASNAGPNNATRAPWVQNGDLLVGLHASPITGLKDLYELLGRDDLQEYQPMKMYVVRRPHTESDDPFGGGFGGEERPPSRDEVISGRIYPDEKAWQATQPELEAAPLWPQVDPTKPSPAQADAASSGLAPGAVLYDGKTFDEWRGLWKQELNPERRIEAVQALGAFASNGYAEEATEAILDVAGEYDFASTAGTFGELKQEILAQLDGRRGPKAGQVAWSLTMHRYGRDPDRYQALMVRLIYGVHENNGRQDELFELAESEDKQIAGAALVRLAVLYGDDPRFPDLLDRNLQSSDPERVADGLRAIGTTKHWPQEADRALLHPNLKVQALARRVAGGLDPNRYREIAERATSLLTAAEDQADQIALCRALAALRRASTKGARGATEALIQSQDETLKYAALVATLVVTNPDVHPTASNYSRSPVFQSFAKELGVTAPVAMGRLGSPEWEAFLQRINNEIAVVQSGR